MIYIIYCYLEKHNLTCLFDTKTVISLLVN